MHSGSLAGRKQKIIHTHTLPDGNPLHCKYEHGKYEREKDEYEIWHPLGRSFCEVCYYKRITPCQ